MSNSTPSSCTLFQPTHNQAGGKLLLVIGISVVTMVMEVAGGTFFGSLALLSDGWHMGTHVFALGVAYGANWLSRRISGDVRFGFGPGKVSALGGFASAILLGIVAFEMMVEGVQRLLHPETIRFFEAIVVAVIGLLVNAVAALLLRDGGHHHHDHGHHDQKHVHGHHDHNLRGAYLHVIADAFTSVLAIVALLLGRSFGWHWLDACVAMVGGVVIVKWSWGLMRTTGATLLDYVSEDSIRKDVHSVIEEDTGHVISDLHLWPCGKRYGVIATISSGTEGGDSSDIRRRLEELEHFDHITVEVR